jgi:hypothetical protein
MSYDERFRYAPRDAYTAVSLDGLISKSWNHQKLIRNGGPTNSMNPICDMRLAFASAPGTLFGIKEDFHEANGRLPRLARNSIIAALKPGEKIIADCGYNDKIFFYVSNGNAGLQKKNICKA